MRHKGKKWAFIWMQLMQQSIEERPFGKLAPAGLTASRYAHSSGIYANQIGTKRVDTE